MTLTEVQGSARASIYVPAGALPTGTTVSVFPVVNSAALVASVPRSQSYVVSFAVSWLAPNGTTPAASAPITMTIVDPSIQAGDTIYVLTAKGLRAVGTATGSGRAKITFTSDPIFVVVQPAVLTRVATTAPLTGTAARVTLSCAPRVNCVGSAALSIAAKTESGRWHRVVLAAGHVAVGSGKARVVTLLLNPTGRRFVAYLERIGRRRIDAVVETALVGGKKSAYPVALPIALRRSA